MNPNQSANQPWRAQAECRGTDPNAFIPEGRGSGELLYIESRQICARCPVKTECLQYALDNGEDYGMWGGTTPQERKELGYTPSGQCKMCGCRFRRYNNHQRYCSDECRRVRRLRPA